MMRAHRCEDVGVVDAAPYSRRAQITAAKPSLAIEWFEDRTLLSMMVTNTDDSGAGTLRQALLDAAASPGADTIAFDLPANDPRHVYYQDDGVAGILGPNSS